MKYKNTMKVHEIRNVTILEVEVLQPKHLSQSDHILQLHSTLASRQNLRSTICEYF